MARILLAEDDNSMRYFLARSLEKAGHEVLAFADGEDAVPALNAGPFDILISDIGEIAIIRKRGEAVFL